MMTLNVTRLSLADFLEVLDGHVNLANNAGLSLRNHVTRLDQALARSNGKTALENAEQEGAWNPAADLIDFHGNATLIEDWLKELPWPLNRQDPLELFSVGSLDPGN